MRTFGPKREEKVAENDIVRNFIYSSIHHILLG
jgi:hypothetical protein